MRTGLSSAEAARRLAEVGPNALPARRRRRLAHLLLGVVREPMLLLLLAATAIYLVFGDRVEALTLGVFVVAIMMIELIQERRTAGALEALRELASPMARVLRDGTWQRLDAHAVVPGDTIRLAEGERVPADATLAEGALLSLDESLLTGESVPVTRDPARHDAVLAGTLVTAGHGIAEVTATGPHSGMARIAAGLGRPEVQRAPVQREVARLVPRIAIAAIALASTLVIVRGATEGAWLAATMSGITLAMSLLPEELPIVLTVFFAVGARRISRHGVLARRASAVETLGAMTVLCVDKTGTLTENRMSIARLVTADTDLVVDGAPELPEAVHRLVELALLACQREPTDPMDRACAACACSASPRRRFAAARRPTTRTTTSSGSWASSASPIRCAPTRRRWSRGVAPPASAS
ncbi:MAG: HAD-IC family P-type ATPase [Deltaproteobacteria bacterium]|nr:HAD-IC family P-type ATPase [Deltaproteobacteria bacterium]